MFIYITTNKINGKRYIGKHTKNDPNYLGSGKYLNNAIRKYGIENFSRKIVYEAKSIEELDFAEKLFIRAFNAVKSPLFYNIAEGGTGGDTISGLNEKELAEFKRKRSEYTKGNKNPLYGRGHTKQSRLKMSKARKGKNKGSENPFFGKKHSDEFKEKFSKNHHNAKKIICITTNEVFNSKNKVYEKYKITPYFLDRAIKNNSEINGLKFKYYEEVI